MTTTANQLPRLRGTALRRRIAELIGPRWFNLVGATVLQGITVVLGLVPPLLLGAVVDGYVAANPLPLGGCYRAAARGADSRCGRRLRRLASCVRFR